MPPSVHPFFHAGSHTWSYVVVEPEGRAAAIIDPVLDFDAASGRVATASAEAVLAFVRQRGLDVQWVLETHAHADHLSAGHWLRGQIPGARLAIGAGIRAVQETFRAVFNLGADFPVDGSQFDHLFADGERFHIGTLEGRVIGVPGHTSDSSAYLLGDALFTGDSLFMPDSGTARCDFPGGDAATLYRSTRRLFALPDATRVFVCHDYGPEGRTVACETTIGAQRRQNTHVREGVDEGEFVAMRQARDATLEPPAESNGVRYLRIPVAGG